MSLSMTKQKTFLPAGVVLTSGFLIVGGLAMAIIGTSIIALKGDITLALLNGFELFKTSSLKTHYGALAVKALIGLFMCIAGARLLTCQKDSVSPAITMLSMTGVLFPVFISVKMTRIDFEFIYVFRGALTILSLGFLYYLSRPETKLAVEQGGVTADLKDTFCPLCELSVKDATCEKCPECETKLSHLYETHDGFNFAVPVENDPVVTES